MTSPRRWLDGGDDLTPDERRVLGADLGRKAPLHAKRAVRAALALELSATSAAAAAARATGGTAQQGAAAKLVSLSVLKSAAVAFALSAVVSAGFSLRERQRAAQDARAGNVRHAAPLSSHHELPTPADSGAAPQSEPSPSLTEAAPGHPLRPSVPREAIGEPASLPATATASESQRVATARALLRSGRASDALTTLQTLDRDEPNGLLAQEREALSIQALAALGQREAARQRAFAFAVRYPASPHLAAVRRAAE